MKPIISLLFSLLLVTAQSGIAYAAAPIVVTDVNNVPISPVDDIPPTSTRVIATSGNVANAAATATIPAVAAKTNYLTGFDVTGTGATVGQVALVTITGLAGGTLTYTLTSVTGTTSSNTNLIRTFDKPLPASGVNVAIVVSCAALGAGSTNNVTNAFAYVK